MSTFFVLFHKYEQVTACGVDAHCTKECILRPIQCSCGLTMPFKDLDEHQRLHCNDRYYYCPQGCGVQIKQENQEYHTEFQCSNKNFRYQKDVDCPNTCGAIMMIRDVLTHLSYHCPRRMVECTLNCGNTVQLDRLAGKRISFELVDWVDLPPVCCLVSVQFTILWCICS